MSIHGQEVIIKNITKTKIEFYTFWDNEFKETETEKIKKESYQLQKIIMGQGTKKVNKNSYLQFLDPDLIYAIGINM